MKITIKNLQNKLPLGQTKIKNLIRRILKGENITASGWINISFVDNALIKKFNSKFLKSRSSTDVLAFNLGNKRKIMLADIMISTDQAILQARSFKTTPGYELLLYVAHGLLHILGFNDHSPEQTKLMRKKESEYVDR